jgi:transcriptional regulator with XRE-family HTH domain
LKLPRLKEVRELHGWSQTKLAQEADVSRDSISNYETGHREAYPATAKKLADALGVAIADLRAPTLEPALPKADAPKTGQRGEGRGIFLPAKVLESLSELWDAQLTRGQYDLATLSQMYNTSAAVAFNHETVARRRDELSPDFQEQLVAAEERFINVDARIWEALEQAERGHTVPPDELAARREAKRQEFRGGGSARHAQ